MRAAENYLPGFADPVHDAQQTFRAVLEAMSRPGTTYEVAPAVQETLRTPGPLGAAAGAVILTLCDEQTPVWLHDQLRETGTVESWLRFHTGARIVEDPAEAMFVVVADPAHAPDLNALACGTDEEPHISATVVIDTPALHTPALDMPPADPAATFRIAGPGIKGQATLTIAGLGAGFLDQWQVNHSRFPRGVDLFLTDHTSVRALPRTTELTALEGRAH